MVAFQTNTRREKMNARDFEKKLFALLFRSTQRITPHFVAYQLDMSFEEAQKQLDQMAANGALRLEIDDNGGIWYEAPGVERGKEPAAAPVYSQPVAHQPESVRVVYAPARFGVFSIAALVLGGFLLFKLLLPLMLIAGVIGLARLAFGHRRSFGGGCGYHRAHRHDWYRR
jgi:hypothetical protein